MTNIVPPTNPLEPHGIKGWMILPMLGTCFSPFINLKGAGDSIDLISKPEFSKYVTSFQILIYVELFFSFAMVCAWGYAIYLLFKHRAQYPVLFNTLLLFTLVFSAAESWLLYSAYGVTLDKASVKDLSNAFFACLIWVPYMLRSRRVKNTFIH